MTVGVVMLVHHELERAQQVARHWAENGCPVVIHVDAKVEKRSFEGFSSSLSDLPDVRFSPRHRCEWGTFLIVEATQTAATLLLDSFPSVQRVYLCSGACLPLRPVEELRAYLESRPDVDFIESATTRDVTWAVGGLAEERFTLRFPFSWKRHRRLFDGYVRLQRRLGMKRRIPSRLTPHMGSQWWCLTRTTLASILQDPERPKYDRYFNRVWIPDESYFQTLARLHSTQIESRSLTLSKFDHQGKPHIFYDDHLELLRQSGCFVARKIWPRAEKLYSTFLGAVHGAVNLAEPAPNRIDRVFAKAAERRMFGRAGLFMQSRFPAHDAQNGMTAAPYSVFEGFSDLFEDFENWLAKVTGTNVHGHLFAPEGAEFAGDETIYAGGLSSSPGLRDYNPKAFLTSLIWNTRGERQCFQFGPRDNQAVTWEFVLDPHAQVSVITGAWAVALYHSNTDFPVLRKRAAELQKIESKHLELLRCGYRRSRVQIWTLADFLEAPMLHLQGIIGEMAPKQQNRLTEAPRMRDLSGFGRFLQKLKNEGMHPYLMGDFPVEDIPHVSPTKKSRPYVVNQ